MTVECIATKSTIKVRIILTFTIKRIQINILPPSIKLVFLKNALVFLELLDISIVYLGIT